MLISGPEIGWRVASGLGVMSINCPPAATYSRARLNHTAAAIGIAAATACSNPDAPGARAHDGDGGDAPHHDPDHQGGERADEQSAAEQHAGERGGADAGPPHLLDHHQQRRAGQRVADLVLRLIQQDPLQAIDRQGAEHPATHGVDVEIADQRQRPVLPPQVEQGVQPLGTGEQHGHHTADQCGGSATRELLAERVEERQEHHAAQDGVGQQEVVQPHFPLQCPVFQRRQQVREPVVVQAACRCETDWPEGHRRPCSLPRRPPSPTRSPP